MTIMFRDEHGAYSGCGGNYEQGNSCEETRWYLKKKWDLKVHTHR